MYYDPLKATGDNKPQIGQDITIMVLSKKSPLYLLQPLMALAWLLPADEDTF